MAFLYPSACPPSPGDGSGFQYHWTLSPVLQLLCVCMFLTITQLEAKGSMGDVGGHVLKLSLSLRKIKQSIGRKVRFNFFFFLSFALLEKTNLPGFVQDSCLFPQRKEERKHEWLQLSFLFLKTTKTVILNFKKGVCYFHMWWILKLGWWTNVFLEIGGGRGFFDYIFFFSWTVFLLTEAL